MNKRHIKKLAEVQPELVAQLSDSQLDMIEAYHDRYMEFHTTDAESFIDTLLVWAMAWGWIEFDPEADTLNWMAEFA